MNAQTCMSVGTNNLLAAAPAKQPSARLRSAIGSSAMLVVSMLLFGGLSVSAQDNPKPIVSMGEVFAVSAPLRDLAKLPAEPEYGFRLPEPVRGMQRAPAGPVVDTVEQTDAGPASNFSVGLNVMGVGNGFSNYVVDWPRPDSNLGVGDTQIVQWGGTVVCSFRQSDRCGAERCNYSQQALSWAPQYMRASITASGT